MVYMTQKEGDVAYTSCTVELKVTSVEKQSETSRALRSEAV